MQQVFGLAFINIFTFKVSIPDYLFPVFQIFSAEFNQGFF